MSAAGAGSSSSSSSSSSSANVGAEVAPEIAGERVTVKNAPDQTGQPPTKRFKPLPAPLDKGYIDAVKKRERDRKEGELLSVLGQLGSSEPVNKGNAKAKGQVKTGVLNDDVCSTIAKFVEDDFEQVLTPYS